MKSNKILVIEDDFYLYELYVRVLKRGGYEVHLATDGVAGIERAREIHPTIILLDIMLPKKNGLEVLQILKTDENTQDIPIYLLTNLAQEQIIKDALAMGAEEYLIKTNNPPYLLLEHVNQIFENFNEA